MNEPRAGLAAVATDDFLYAIGGVDGRRFLRSVEYAPLRDDGSPGPWQYTAPLPAPRGFSDAVVHNGHIYLVGGANGAYGKNLLQSILRAPILPDGRLGPWQEEAEQTLLPRRCTKLALVGNRLFSLGGFGGTLLDSVESTTIGASGALTEWRMEPKAMTRPRYVNAVKSVRGFLYVIGGHHSSNGAGISAVEVARQSDHALEWQEARPLRTGRYGLAAATHQRWLYALGGLSGAEYLRTVERSRVGTDGQLGEWQVTTRLPVPMASFAAVTRGENIYLLGGTTAQGYRNAVTYATFNAQGDVGFYGEPRAAVDAGGAADSPLPRGGTVVTTLDAGAYTYIQVEGDDGRVWLAAPAMRLVPGARIRYSEGVYMSNFYSKELKRNFPGVRFVGTVKVQESSGN